MPNNDTSQSKKIAGKTAPDEWSSDLENAKSLVIQAVLVKRGTHINNPDNDPYFEFDLSAEDAAEAQQLLVRLQAEAEALVAENWPAITRVARFLFAHRSLSVDE